MPTSTQFDQINTIVLAVASVKLSRRRNLSCCLLHCMRRQTL